MKYIKKALAYFTAICILFCAASHALAAGRITPDGGILGDSGHDSGGIDSGGTKLLLSQFDTPGGVPVLLPRNAQNVRQAFETQFGTDALYRVNGRTDTGELIACAVTYDFRQVQTQQSGKKLLSGQIVPPHGYEIEKGAAYEIPYAVLAPTRVDLSGYHETADGNLFFRWLYDYSASDKKLLYSTGTLTGQDGSRYCGYLDGQSLLLLCTELEEDTEYYFHIRYGGGMRSNTVMVKRSGKQLSVFASPKFPPIWSNGMDQDGGDRDEQPMPPIIQPMPSGAEQEKQPAQLILPQSIQNFSNIPNTADAPAALDPPPYCTDTAPAAQQADKSPVPLTVIQSQELPESSAPPVFEIVNADETVLSGLRLRHMLAQNASHIVFEKHGICIHLPAAFFETLALAEDELFSVRIEKPDDTSFVLAMTMAGEPVLELPPTTVYFPLSQAPPEDTAVYDTAGNRVCGTVYQEAQQLVTFELLHTGTYRIGTAEQPGLSVTDAAKKAARQKNRWLCPSAVVLIIGGAGIGGAIYHKRKKR